MPLLGVGFSIGSSGDEGGIGKSLDELIADRRKEQSKASTGRTTRTNAKADKQAKKTAAADRSIATGRAKRAAAARARRGLSTTGDKKPTAMEIEKESYRQARKTATSKKRTEQKKTGGRAPPNSSLREKKANKVAPKKDVDPPGAISLVTPKKKQINAALKGMTDAGCPLPQGYQMIMQFVPIPVAPVPETKRKGPQSNKNTKKKAGGKGGKGGKK